MYSTIASSTTSPVKYGVPGVHRGRVPKPLSTVSVATPDDRDELRDFLISLHEELGCDDQNLLADMVDELVHRRGGIAWIVRGDDRANPVEASLGLYLTRPLPLSRQYRLRSAWNIVLPERRRKTGHAKSLLLVAQQFAAQLGLPALIEEEYIPAKHKLFVRHFGIARLSYSTAAPRNIALECPCAVCKAHRAKQFERLTAK